LWSVLLLVFFSCGALFFLVLALQDGSVLRWFGFALNVFCAAGSVAELQRDDSSSSNGTST
jgi:hypothetical protein